MLNSIIFISVLTVIGAGVCVFLLSCGVVVCLLSFCCFLLVYYYFLFYFCMFLLSFCEAVFLVVLGYRYF